MATCSAVNFNVLKKFYPALSTKKGGSCEKASYSTLRATVHLRIRELNWPFILFQSVEFSESHCVLDTVLKLKNAEGLEPSVGLKEAIISADDYK